MNKDWIFTGIYIVNFIHDLLSASKKEMPIPTKKV